MVEGPGCALYGERLRARVRPGQAVRSVRGRAVRSRGEGKEGGTDGQTAARRSSPQGLRRAGPRCAEPELLGMGEDVGVGAVMRGWGARPRGWRACAAAVWGGGGVVRGDCLYSSFKL